VSSGGGRLCRARSEAAWQWPGPESRGAQLLSTVGRKGGRWGSLRLSKPASHHGPKGRELPRGCDLSTDSRYKPKPELGVERVCQHVVSATGGHVGGWRKGRNVAGEGQLRGSGPASWSTS
jgi:hypothetical protein